MEYVLPIAAIIIFVVWGWLVLLHLRGIYTQLANIKITLQDIHSVYAAWVRKNDY